MTSTETIEILSGATVPSPRRISPARVLQHHLKGWEKSIDETLAGGTDALGNAIRLGLLADVVPAVSQPIIERMLAGLSAGTQMRAATSEAHRMIDAVGKTINLRELGFGDGVSKPDVAPGEDLPFVPRRPEHGLQA